jgi:tetratricopeptide (TPR) repeat protein
MSDARNSRLAGALLAIFFCSFIAGPALAGGKAVDPTKNAKKAVKTYSRAVEKAPDDPDGWYNLCLAHNILENWAEAETAGRRAMALSPDNEKILYLLGTALLATDQSAEAIPLLEKAVAADPGYYEAQVSLGRAYAAGEQYEDGIKAYKAALKTKPEHPGPLYNNVGDAYFKMGDMKQATRWFERTAEQSPNDPIVHFNLGALFLKMAQKDPSVRVKAAESFAKSSDLDLQDAKTAFLAGEQMFLIDDVDRAKKYFARYPTLDPSGSKAGAQVHGYYQAYMEEMNK